MMLLKSLALLSLFAVSAFAQLGINYAVATDKKPTPYFFAGWPKGSPKPVFFKSPIYASDTGSYVRIGSSFLRPDDPTKVRVPADFDSLKATRQAPVMVAGVPYEFDSTWTTALMTGNRWLFPGVSGAITLYAKGPGSSAYVAMDTGAGLVPYSEAAVRARIAGSPAAAKWLRGERRGHLAAWGMAGVGASMVAAGTVTGFVNAGGETFKANGVLLGGIGVAALSWIPHLVVQGHYRQAVRAYNAEHEARRDGSRE